MGFVSERCLNLWGGQGRKPGSRAKRLSMACPNSCALVRLSGARLVGGRTLAHALVIGIRSRRNPGFPPPPTRGGVAGDVAAVSQLAGPLRLLLGEGLLEMLPQAWSVCFRASSPVQWVSPTGRRRLPRLPT